MLKTEIENAEMNLWFAFCFQFSAFSFSAFEFAPFAERLNNDEHQTARFQQP
jgi:hypothetical protein